MTEQPSTLLTPVISSPAMQAVLSDRARLQRMLDFAVALVRAQAAIGMMPVLAIDPIANAARAEQFDLDALGKQALASGSMAEPLMQALTEQVAKTDSKAAGYVNWGASSQDILDTALVLDLKAAIDVLMADLERAIESFITLAGRHRRALTVAASDCSMACPFRSASSSPAMPRRWRVRATDCGGCAARRWCCNSAAQSVHLRR
jgi:3-carboxy-cis,cis-muconate cycloisomerase